MIVLETNKIFQRFIGLQSSGPGSHRGYIIAPILISIPILSLVLSISLNFILNIHDDSNRVWSTLPTTIALFVFIILYWHLLFNRRQFYSLFENMQDIVDESAWQPKCNLICAVFIRLNISQDRKETKSSTRNRSKGLKFWRKYVRALHFPYQGPPWFHSS